MFALHSPSPSAPIVWPSSNLQQQLPANTELSMDNTNFNYAASRMGAPKRLDIENISNYELKIHENIICDYCY